MDYKTYKTDSSEYFEMDQNTGFVKMDVIWAPHFKVGNIIFFHNILFHLLLQITVPLSANEFPAPFENSSPALPFFSTSPRPHPRGMCRGLSHSSEVMEEK